MFWSVELSVLCCIMLLVVSTGHESTLCEIDNKCLDWLILVLWVFCTSRCNADIHNQLSTIHFLQWWEVSRHCLILRQYFHCLGLDTSQNDTCHVPSWTLNTIHSQLVLVSVLTITVSVLVLEVMEKRAMKTREWTSRHEEAVVDNAGVAKQ